jgi:cell division protein FtsW (lipid II flippase)
MQVPNWIKPLILPNAGWLSIAAALALSWVGLLAIDTATATNESVRFAARQAVFIPAALIVMVIAALPHYRRIAQVAHPLLVLTLLMLVVVMLPFMPRSFVPVINGARRWFDIGIIQFQPSELTKIAYVLSLACYLRYRSNYRTLRGLIPPLIITFIPMGLIVIEPDLGTSMIFLPVFFAMLITAGARLKHLIILVLIGVMIMPAMYPLLKDHQKARIHDVVARFAGQTQHSQTISFQGTVATTITGSGQLIGNDSEHAASLIHYSRLPEPHNDMIFAVVCTRWGLLGGLGVLGLYVLLIGSGLLAAALNKDPFARLVAVGVVSVIFTQVFVNIGMTIGLLPITGMTLPFVSYGGSSLLANFVIVGLLVNVAARRPIVMAQPSFEYDRPAGPSSARRDQLDHVWGGKRYTEHGMRA